jgi:hypothetical protein
MTIERANPNVGATRDGFQTGLWPAGGENLARRFQQALAIQDRIRARLAASFGGQPHFR